jgi:hypothetical protein
MMNNLSTAVMNKYQKSSQHVQHIRQVLLLLLGAFAATSSIAVAQTPSVAVNGGFQPNRDYLSLQPWESIDTANGNVMMQFVDLTLTGNAGQTLRIGRGFSNRMGGGPSKWFFSINGLPLTVTIPDGPGKEGMEGGVGGEQKFTPRFNMPDGSTKTTTFMDSNASWVVTTTRWSRTADFWRFDRDYSSDGRMLYLPDGQKLKYDKQNRLKQISDLFGNTITLTWSEDRSLLTIEQSVGADTRSVELTMNPELGLPLQMRFNGGTWTYDYPVYPWRIDAVHTPENLHWYFTYEGSQSRIKQVTTPNTGTVIYTYGPQSFTLSNGGEGSFETLIARNSDAKPGLGSWSFSYLHDNGAPAGMIANVPGNKRVEWTYVQEDTTFDILLGDSWLLTAEGRTTRCTVVHVRTEFPRHYP